MNRKQNVQDTSVSLPIGKPMLSDVRSVYVLTVSEFFPKTHPKAGLPTGFINAISAKTKRHTIRSNYELWSKRAEKINKGGAVLSVRYWTGKPYNSKQKEVFVLEKICVEKLELTPLGFFVDGIESDLTVKKLSKNDGLSEEDFKAWFKGQDFSEPKAIIHFNCVGYIR